MQLLTDIDGCISERRWTGLSLAAVSQLGGAELFFTSGRSQPYIECLSQTFGSLRPFICENGSSIFSPVQNRYTWIAPNATRLASQKDNILRKLSSALPDLDVILEPGKDFSVSLSLVDKQGESLAMSLAHKRVAEALQALEGICVTHSNSAVDIIGAGVNKGSALLRLADQLGLTAADFAGFGDSSNDLPFLSMVGYCGCPANATMEVKAAVSEAKGYCSPYPNIQGLLDFIAMAKSRS